MDSAHTHVGAQRGEQVMLGTAQGGGQVLDLLRRRFLRVGQPGRESVAVLYHDGVEPSGRQCPDHLRASPGKVDAGCDADTDASVPTV